MIGLKVWQEECVKDSMVYYWDKDNVQMCKIREALPSYRKGELHFMLDHSDWQPEELHLFEKDCARYQIEQIKKGFQLEGV